MVKIEILNTGINNSKMKKDEIFKTKKGSLEIKPS
jgi:hypothetical protein